jgi:hypothetical protein
MGIPCHFGAVEPFNWSMLLSSLGSLVGRGSFGRINEQLQCAFEVVDHKLTSSRATGTCSCSRRLFRAARLRKRLSGVQAANDVKVSTMLDKVVGKVPRSGSPWIVSRDPATRIALHSHPP